MSDADDQNSSRILVEKWRKGDQAAAQKLFDRYVDQLLALARRRISQRLASRVDAEDVVQSVFRTFFTRAREGQFRIQERDDLAKLLVRITLHKTLRQVEFHKAAKRDPSQEAGQSSEAREKLFAFLDGEPAPEMVVACLDEMEHFLNKLRPDERQVLELRLQGYTNREIADKLGTYDRKIRRVIEYVQGLAKQDQLLL
jgi:RNA polymerase sigma-70 factor (ECF subfamily)